MFSRSSHIFIGHASEDQQVADALRFDLEGFGLNCWIAWRDVPTGENLQTAAARAFRNTHVMLLIYTSNTGASEEAKKELILASQNDVKVIPLRVEEIEPVGVFAFEFATRQWIDMFEDWSGAVGRLVARLTTPDLPGIPRSSSLPNIGLSDTGLIVPATCELSDYTGKQPLARTDGVISGLCSDSAAVLALPRFEDRGTGDSSETDFHRQASIRGPLLSIADGLQVSRSVTDRPSILAFPFRHSNSNPQEKYLADGMLEEIVTALSRIRGLSVIAHNSAFGRRGRHANIQSAGRELGVRYSLRGSVRIDRDRLRITARLSDAVTGADLWADEFEAPLQAVFELQDQVARCIAGLIEPGLEAAETARSDTHQVDDLDADELYQHAQQMYLASARKIPEALGLLERAIERDPAHGRALAWLRCAAAGCFSTTEAPIGSWTG